MKGGFYTKIEKMAFSKSLPEKDFYFAASIESGYPTFTFKSLKDCLIFCKLNCEDFYAITKDFRRIYEN